MGRYTSGSVARDIAGGAIAGIAAIWVADKLDQAIYRKGSRASIRKTEAARPGGMDPAHVLAKRAADSVGVDIGNPRDNPAGHTIHYGIAAAFGALYGLMRGMSPAVATGRGAAFGLAMFVLKDEIGNTAMGTAGNPLSYPVRDHARGAATHAVFGVLTDLGTRLVSPWRDEVVIEQGPPLSERLDHGRATIIENRDYLMDQGRQTLGRGMAYAGHLAEQARARLPEVDIAAAAERGRVAARHTARTLQARLPDADDVSDYTSTGARQARRTAEELRSRLPDPSTVTRSGRRFADDMRETIEDRTSGLSRAVRRIFA